MLSAASLTSPPIQAAPRSLVSLSAYLGPRILILNNKGGVGKSTITTQLLTLLNQQGHRPALVDFDPQGSSLQWAQEQPDLYAVDDDPRRARLESMRLRVPADAGCILMDSPANLDPALLSRLLGYADRILLPCQANPLDVKALGRFLPDLLFHPQFRRREPAIGVLANRLQSDNQTELLERFLTPLKIPLLASLPERQQYRDAVVQNGHNELDPQAWQRLLAWLEL
ncbi:ParA family protein [Ferrimonas marina]|uniref:Chromosome partitioning protein n=1 Tax=Ferrimonas marina TaxID=299255 RepID=A0A1M5Y2C9_9GAMM|nr:ParA family protein [Ferrimonas marina]SHI06126.1 chromosome partitioning protein [Ferrimonas marina]